MSGPPPCALCAPPDADLRHVAVCGACLARHNDDWRRAVDLAVLRRIGARVARTLRYDRASGQWRPIPSSAEVEALIARSRPPA
jgi:hypothetical protein